MSLLTKKICVSLEISVVALVLFVGAVIIVTMVLFLP